MKRTIQAAWLALREGLSQPTLERKAEPAPDMSDQDNVRAFHAEGSDQGALLGVYHFNAQAIHALAPKGATVVDLGCGSGQCLRYFAMRRPDLRLVGIDLSEQMVSVGKAMLRQHGLSERVELRVGDMTSFLANVPAPVHLVTSIFSLHHLPTDRHLHACLHEIGRVRSRDGAGVWIFDHARPKRRDTAERFPRVFTPAALPVFNADSTNSLIASWSFQELQSALAEAIGERIEGSLARLLRLYQVHWAAGRSAAAAKTAEWLAAPALPKSAQKDADGLAGLFSRLPQKTA